MSATGADHRLEAAELRALLTLCVLPGLSGSRLRGLLRRHGSAEAALAALPEELGEVGGARAVREQAGRVARAQRTIERLGVEVLVEADPRYPRRLLQLHDPPAVLFARGRLELLERPAVAVVGARRHTAYGAEAAKLLAGGLAGAGVVVVSGLARGIDGIAHEAALAGGTIAVLGCGIDVAYPRENAALQERIAQEGLLLSEFAPGVPALPYHFPRRNRLIAALSAGVVVVEASAKSGSLITADHALELGREVFAVPGPINRETSVGTNALIRDGATLVTGVADILEALGLEGRGGGVSAGEEAEAPEGLDGERLALWRVLRDEPLHVDELAGAAGLSPAGALAGLLELELAGWARQYAGKRFARVGR